MSFINCEIILVLNWSEDCGIPFTTWATKFAIADTKPYIPVVILSIKDNAETAQRIKIWF